MDQMLSYCSTNSTFDQSNTCDSDLNLLILNNQQNFRDGEEFDLENGVDHNYYTKQINTLMAQCNQYQNVIKRQENEIIYYRKHIESLEDDFSKITNSLTNAKKSVKIYKDKISSYERTIDSLENEIEDLNSRISPEKESKKCLSFSTDIDFQINNHNTDPYPTSSIYSIVDNDNLSKVEKNKIIVTLKEMCNQNVEMKTIIDLLQKEINRLKIDNEEYRTLLWNSREDFYKDPLPKNHFKVSTPIKNFISYQALNISYNNSFSIDEDYECDNMIFDDNFKYLSSTLNEIRQINIENNTFNISKFTGFDLIENEEMPSRIVKDDLSTIQTTRSIESTNYIFTESMKKTISREVSLIENQKFPPICYDSTCIVTEASETSKEKSICEDQNTFCGGNETKSRLKLCEDEILQSKSNDKSFRNLDAPNFIEHFFFYSSLPSVITSSLTSSFRNFCFRLTMIFVTIIFILSSSSINYKNFDMETRIIPYYSIQEIIMDILNQFCSLKHF